MKQCLLRVFSALYFFFVMATAHAAGDLTISSVAVPAGNINQGSSYNIVYIAKLDAGGENVSINNIIANIAGTYDADDVASFSVYYNSTGPSLTGASFGGSLNAPFAGLHSFSIPAYRTVAAGSSVYVIIVANLTSSATDNHTVIINGAANPVTVLAAGTPNIINNQTDAAGVQTIQAADITFTSVAVPAANLNQGSNYNIVYITKLDAATEPVNITNIVTDITGNYDADDVASFSVYYNSTGPSLTGASFGGSLNAPFAGPHNFSIPAYRTVAAGSSVYVIIVANLTSSATDNHTVIINGAANPVSIITTTEPNIINNQIDAAGVQTIQAADITFTSVAVAAANLNQGSNYNIVYITKLDAATEPVNITHIVANITGTYDADDVASFSIYYNSTGPSLTGASFGGSLNAPFAGPHNFSIPAYRTITAGSSVYVIIVANLTSSATDNHTIIINGAANPVSVLSTTAPNIINNQTNAAGVQTIQASDLLLSTVAMTDASFTPNSNSNLIYLLKMELGAQPVTSTNLLVTVDGTFSNTDLGTIALYYNLTPTLTGSSFLGSAAANFSSPHSFTIPAFKTLPAGSTVYFLITANVTAAAAINKTIFVNGATNPVSLTYTSAPNVTNNQSDVAGVFTISNALLPVTLTGFAATIMNSKIKVEWTTSSELNADNFMIQWSTDGISYTTAGSVQAQGDSGITRQYTFLHATPSKGFNYYRLKLVDIDGHFTYSPVVRVKVNSFTNKILISPNPVNNELRLVMNNTQDITLLRIFDMNGKIIWQGTPISTNGTLIIPFAKYGNGMYHLEITNPDGQERLSFIKIH